MSRAKAIAAGVAILMSGIALSGTESLADSRMEDVVRVGQLRIGVFPSFQYSKDVTSGQPRGLAIGIARALAANIGLTDVVTIEHSTPPNVIQCVKAGDCHFGFMLIDPARAAEVDFTPPFVRSDFTYLLPPRSELQSAREVDRPGVRIAVVRGHASTAALERAIKQARPIYADSYEAAVDLLRVGGADAFASIREMLLQYASHIPDSRVLEDSYQSNLAGVAVSKEHAGRLAYMSEFLDRMKRSGSLRRLVDTLGLRGINVVPPTDPK